MKKNAWPLFVLFSMLGVWLVLLASVYRRGEEREAMIYVQIPEETIRFFTGLADAVDQFIVFDPEVSLDDWDNRNDYGDDARYGLMKLEDSCFVIYFSKKKQEMARAQKIQRWAHEAIEPLANLMGQYHYPKDVKDRKLPIYLAETGADYTRIIGRLLEKPELKEQSGSWGMYVCSYSRLGCLTKGIVLHPDTWVTDKDAKSTLWHEMNHYEFYSSLDFSKTVTPYLWVSEGLAEFFSKGYPRLGGEQCSRLKDEHLNHAFKNELDNYLGGQTIYQTLSDKYGRKKLRDFIRYTYSYDMEQVYPKALQSSREQFELVWKQHIDSFR